MKRNVSISRYEDIIFSKVFIIITKYRIDFNIIGEAIIDLCKDDKLIRQIYNVIFSRFGIINQEMYELQMNRRPSKKRYSKIELLLEILLCI
jgi:hypothetical protein